MNTFDQQIALWPERYRLFHPTLKYTFDQQIALWPEQIPTRTEIGDRLEEPRPVDHFAYFRRRTQALAAAADLQALGFDTQVDKSGLFKSVLQATRPEVLNDASVRAFLSEVIETVEAASGDYDGWGAPVITSDD